MVSQENLKRQSFDKFLTDKNVGVDNSLSKYVG